MRLLVLGGTRFLSREVAAQAVGRGWDVTCACRGESGSVPDGASLLRWDRADEPPPELAGVGFDAVLDVARLPSHVRRAVAAVPQAHWVFVSTLNVYADSSSPATGPLLEPAWQDLDPAASPQAYGAMKVACERLVAEGAASALLVRPGLIVGPGDPTGRFSYWPDRFTRGGEVLAPGDPDDPAQVIDVRDLATWLLDAAESRVTGTFDAVGISRPLAETLAQVAAGVDASPDLTWVDAAFLEEFGVQPWAGDDAVPLWLPRPDHNGMTTRDAGPAILAGLRLRPLAETARDTLGAPVVGITAEREAEVLQRWHDRHHGPH